MSCTHYFLLPQPNGPTVLGQCKHCGLEREHEVVADRERGSRWARWDIDRPLRLEELR